MKPTGRYCFCLFHSQEPKPKRNHQISSSRVKTRSRRSQTCVKYRGNIICSARNTGVNKSDLKKLHKKTSKKGWFSRRYHQFFQKFMSFSFHLMHGWRAMDLMVHLAPRYQGHSLSVQCYEIYLHAILFLLLIHTQPPSKEFLKELTKEIIT